MPVSLALSGKLRFPTAGNAKDANQGKVSGGVVLVAARTLGDFSLNVNVRYAAAGAQSGDAVTDAWFLGVAVQCLIAKKYTLFVESYASPPVAHFRNTVINADGGLL